MHVDFHSLTCSLSWKLLWDVTFCEDVQGLSVKVFSLVAVHFMFAAFSLVHVHVFHWVYVISIYNLRLPVPYNYDLPT